MVLVLFLAGVLLLPHALIRFVFPSSIWWPELLVIVSLLGFALAVFGIGLNIDSFDAQAPKQDSWMARLRARASSQQWIQTGVVLPVLAAAFVFAMWHVPSVLGMKTEHLSDRILRPIFGIGGQSHGWTAFFPFSYLAPENNSGQQIAENAGLITLVLLGTLLAVSFVGRYDRCFYDGEPGKTRPRQGVAWLTILGTAAAASLVGGILTMLFSRLWVLPDNSANLAVTQHLIAAFVFGPPILLGVFGLTLVLQIGLLGRNLPDERREWWSRFGAWGMIYGLGWMVLTGISLYGPTLLEWVANRGRGWIAGGGLAWIGTTILGVFNARSAETSAKTERVGGKGRWMNLVATAAPYVFILGLLLAISYGIHHAIHSPVTETTQVSAASWEDVRRMLDVSQSPWLPWISTLACLGMAGLLGWRIDVNEFSMHHFYKNRLVRCYLGASRIKERKVNPFTGFDPAMRSGWRTLRVDKDPTVPEELAYAALIPS